MRVCVCGFLFAAYLYGLDGLGKGKGSGSHFDQPRLAQNVIVIGIATVFVRVFQLLLLLLLLLLLFCVFSAGFCAHWHACFLALALCFGIFAIISRTKCGFSSLIAFAKWMSVVILANFHNISIDLYAAHTNTHTGCRLPLHRAVCLPHSLSSSLAVPAKFLLHITSASSSCCWLPTRTNCCCCCCCFCSCCCCWRRCLWHSNKT